MRKIKNKYQSVIGLSLFLINPTIKEYLYNCTEPLPRLLPNKHMGLIPMWNKDKSAGLTLIRKEIIMTPETETTPPAAGSYGGDSNATTTLLQESTIESNNSKVVKG